MGTELERDDGGEYNENADKILYTEDTYKKAKDRRLARYVAVTLDNFNTIEFRMFRGTLIHF